MRFDFSSSFMFIYVYIWLLLLRMVVSIFFFSTFTHLLFYDKLNTAHFSSVDRDHLNILFKAKLGFF